MGLLNHPANLSTGPAAVDGRLASRSQLLVERCSTSRCLGGSYEDKVEQLLKYLKRPVSFTGLDVDNVARRVDLDGMGGEVADVAERVEGVLDVARELAADGVDLLVQVSTGSPQMVNEGLLQATPCERRRGAGTDSDDGGGFLEVAGEGVGHLRRCLAPRAGPDPVLLLEEDF